MIFMNPLPFLLLETFLFWFFVSEYGFLPVVGAYIAPSLLGMLVLSFQARGAVDALQRRLAEGREPGFQVLNTASKFFTGLLLIAPFFTTRVLGFALLIPGLRHLILLIAQTWLVGKLASGAFRGANFAFSASGRGFPGMGPQGAQEPNEVRAEREVIDITPLEVTHEDRKD